MEDSLGKAHSHEFFFFFFNRYNVIDTFCLHRNLYISCYVTIFIIFCDTIFRNRQRTFSITWIFKKIILLFVQKFKSTGKNTFVKYTFLLIENKKCMNSQLQNNSLFFVLLPNLVKTWHSNALFMLWASQW